MSAVKFFDIAFTLAISRNYCHTFGTTPLAGDFKGFYFEYIKEAFLFENKFLVIAFL